MPLSGVRYSFELERELVAHWANYKLEEFIQLPTDHQAHHIAAYRCAKRIDAVLAHDRDKQNKVKQRASKPPRRARRRR